MIILLNLLVCVASFFNVPLIDQHLSLRIIKHEILICSINSNSDCRIRKQHPITSDRFIWNMFYIIIIYKYVHIPTSALCLIFLIIEQMFEGEIIRKIIIWFSKWKTRFLLFLPFKEIFLQRNSICFFFGMVWVKVYNIIRYCLVGVNKCEINKMWMLISEIFVTNLTILINKWLGSLNTMLTLWLGAYFTNYQWEISINVNKWLMFSK